MDYRSRVTLSIVIPAYNEERYLPATLEALHQTMPADIEILVVDNDSTDTTRAIAERYGARVIDEHEHNIARVRNTGAEAAAGAVIVFVDADTIVRPGVLEKVVEAMSDGQCLGGSAAVEYEPSERMWVRFFMRLWPMLGKLTKMRGGALQFCRSDVFLELGGYDTTIYVGEDLDFHWRLDRLAADRGGHTAFVDAPRVLTSSRRWNRMGVVRMLFFTSPITILLAWRVRGFWKDWYERAIR